MIKAMIPKNDIHEFIFTFFSLQRKNVIKFLTPVFKENILKCTKSNSFNRGYIKEGGCILWIILILCLS